MSPNMTHAGVLAGTLVLTAGLLLRSHPSPPPNHHAGAVGTIGNWKMCVLVLFPVLFSMLLLDIYAVFVTVFPLNAPCTTFTSKVNAGISSVCHVASIVCSFGHTTPCIMLRVAWTQMLV